MIEFLLALALYVASLGTATAPLPIRLIEGAARVEPAFLQAYRDGRFKLADEYEKPIYVPTWATWQPGAVIGPRTPQQWYLEHRAFEDRSRGLRALRGEYESHAERDLRKIRQTLEDMRYERYRY